MVDLKRRDERLNSDETDLVEVELARILIRETEDTHFLELREVAPESADAAGFHDEGDADDSNTRSFPIVIGFAEAAAIERRLMGQHPARPQTHELLANVIDELGYDLERVVITDLRDHTFYAELQLANPASGQRVLVDARPSDAIALGVGVGCPLYAAAHILDAAAH